MASADAKSGDHLGQGDNIASVRHDEGLARQDTAPEEGVLQKGPVIEKVDEFGAHAKTDPREIALVRKLDRHILVRTIYPAAAYLPTTYLGYSLRSCDC